MQFGESVTRFYMGNLLSLPVIKKMVDKGIRNKITLMRRDGIKGMEKLMQFWFSTRI